MLELINVSKVYRRDSVAVKALDGVSLKVAKGEFAVISGQSGRRQKHLNCNARLP